MIGGQPYSQPVLNKDLWQLLFTRALWFATKYINRLIWRGSPSGVLPDGHNAESIAAEAVADFLQQQQATQQLVPSPLSQPSFLSPFSNGPSLSRLVWRHVDRLHHRAENFLLRNEADLAPFHSDDGETCSFIETIPDPGSNPFDNLIRKEATTNFESQQTQLTKFLGRDPRFNSLLACYGDGIWQPRHIAPRLQLSVPATKNLQKRLKRRLRKFIDQQSHVE